MIKYWIKLQLKKIALLSVYEAVSKLIKPSAALQIELG